MTTILQILQPCVSASGQRPTTETLAAPQVPRIKRSQEEAPHGADVARQLHLQRVMDSVMQSRNIGLPRDSNGRQPYRLTIAEDDDDIRDAPARLLTQDGFEVTQVANGELLVQQLESESHQLDMLILDHRMPGYSGLDILRVLHRWGWDIPVIMITAFGKEVFPEARSLGACAVFEKPFDHDDLRAAVHFYLSAPSSSPARAHEGPGEDGDLDLVFSDSWEAFEVWVRQTIGGDFTWFARPRDTPESRQIIIDSIRAAMAANDATFPKRNELLKRRRSG